MQQDEYDAPSDLSSPPSNTGGADSHNSGQDGNVVERLLACIEDSGIAELTDSNRDAI